MNARTWVLLGLALAMMAATAGYLEKIRNVHRLGPAGVHVGPVPLLASTGNR